MFQFTLKRLLLRAINGEEKAREELIVKHRDYISRVSSRVCRRFLSWENDDELSIALLAFNEAIDSYDFKQGASFASFAYTVIQRRLTDYFRRNPAKYELLLSVNPDRAENHALQLLEQRSQRIYQEDVQQERMAETIELYQHHLALSGIAREALVQCSPKHRDTRERFIQVAVTVAHNQDLLKVLNRTRKLPVKELLKITGLSTRVLEKGRRYIIATVLVFTEPELSALKSFTQGFIPETGRENA